VIDQELALMQSRGEVKKNLAAMKDVYLRIKPFVEPPKETSEKESQVSLILSVYQRTLI
jgi:hypothetical protein